MNELSGRSLRGHPYRFTRVHTWHVLVGSSHTSCACSGLTGAHVTLNKNYNIKHKNQYPVFLNNSTCKNVLKLSLPAVHEIQEVCPVAV